MDRVTGSSLPRIRYSSPIFFPTYTASTIAAITSTKSSIFKNLSIAYSPAVCRSFLILPVLPAPVHFLPLFCQGTEWLIRENISPFQIFFSPHLKEILDPHLPFITFGTGENLKPACAPSCGDLQSASYSCSDTPRDPHTPAQKRQVSGTDRYG